MGRVALGLLDQANGACWISGRMKLAQKLVRLTGLRPVLKK